MFSPSRLRTSNDSNGDRTEQINSPLKTKNGRPTLRQPFRRNTKNLPTLCFESSTAVGLVYTYDVLSTLCVKSSVVVG